MRRASMLLLCVSVLVGCEGVPTGKISPCHGQFRAQGKFFTKGVTADGTEVVVSTKNPATGCGD